MSTVKYEKLVEEDLNVGTDVVWIHAPQGGELCSTQIGIHTPARGQKRYTTTWVPGAVAASSYVTTTVTVADATVGDPVLASFTSQITNDFTISAHVSAANTVKVVIYNPTTTAVTLNSGTLAVVVFPMGEGISEVVSTWTVGAGITLDGDALGLVESGFTWRVELWHHKADVAGALGAAPAEPDFELIDTTNVMGGDPNVTNFTGIPTGVYSILATTTSSGGFATEEANAYTNPSVAVSADTQLANLPFTRPGGGE